MENLDRPSSTADRLLAEAPHPSQTQICQHHLTSRFLLPGPSPGLVPRWDWERHSSSDQDSLDSQRI